MKIDQVTAVYFSATGTSMRSVVSIGRPLAERMDAYDVTLWEFVPENKTFGPNELVIFGAPVYGGRIYKGAMERFARFHGDNTPCIVTCTYGNRHYDDALLEMKETLESQGFRPIAAAALIGQHTFGEIAVGRPNRLDMDEDKAFAEKVLAKLAADDLSIVEVPGNHPYKAGGNGGRFRPLTNDQCTFCRICVMECPEQAIAQDCITIDNDKCISCFHCIKECPMKAKHMDVPAYNDFAKNFSEKLAAPRANEYFL